MGYQKICLTLDAEFFPAFKSDLLVYFVQFKVQFKTRY